MFFTEKKKKQTSAQFIKTPILGIMGQVQECQEEVSKIAICS